MVREIGDWLSEKVSETINVSEKGIKDRLRK
jgi:hypothetical protein